MKPTWCIWCDLKFYSNLWDKYIDIISIINTYYIIIQYYIIIIYYSIADGEVES